MKTGDEGAMNKIFMTYLKRGQDKNQVKIVVFHKGTREHLKNLIGFLRNQNINCSEIPQQDKKKMEELSYFNEGFYITLDPDRWSFYELRSYIQTYADSCEEDAVLRDTLRQELSTCDEDIVFDDQFYVQLTTEIDKCKNLYYQENMSISLFLSSLLKLLRQNLQLYWAAAKLMDIQTRRVSYLNLDPPSLPRNDILKSCSSSPSGSVFRQTIEFCGMHIADIYGKPGPFSPAPSVTNKFLLYVITHIENFIYGHLIHKMETYRLKSELAELRKQQQPSTPLPPEREQITRKKHRLLLLGDTQLSNGQIYSAFSHFDFDRKNIELHTEWDKYRAYDTNSLLAVRSRYDGILLGPMPHSMKGDLSDGDGLIAQMQHEPDRYPPFVVLRDKRGKLKITKESLKSAIKDLVFKLDQVSSYK